MASIVCSSVFLVERFSFVFHDDCLIEVGNVERASFDQDCFFLCARCFKLRHEIPNFFRSFKESWCCPCFSTTAFLLGSADAEHVRYVFDSEITLRVETSAVGAVVPCATASVSGKTMRMLYNVESRQF